MDDTILLSIFCLAMMTHIFLRPRPPPPPPTLPLTPSIICHHDCEIGRAERGLEDRVKRSGGAPRSSAQEKTWMEKGTQNQRKKLGIEQILQGLLCTIYQRQRRSFKFLTTSVTSFGPYEGIVETPPFSDPMRKLTEGKVSQPADFFSYEKSPNAIIGPVLTDPGHFGQFDVLCSRFSGELPARPK